MPRITYVEKTFQPKTMAIIDMANKICREYADKGYDLTLRQLYYQFVARGLIANKQTEYDRLGAIINDARLAGMLDWSYIVDRTRNVRSNSHWESPNDIVAACASQFQFDKWEDQPRRVEVWIEKDALIGVIERVCTRNDIAYFSCRGYTSQSEVWGAAQRHLNYEDHHQRVIVLHLGDHDPSGIDMSRDIQDRLEMFGTRTELRRLGLNMGHIDQYSPPPNPAKLTDARAQSYIERFGPDSWELDAMSPEVIEQWIEDAIREVRNAERWEAARARERRARAGLRLASERWQEVEELVAVPNDEEDDEEEDE